MRDGQSTTRCRNVVAMVRDNMFTVQHARGGIYKRRWTIRKTDEGNMLYVSHLWLESPTRSVLTIEDRHINFYFEWRRGPPSSVGPTMIDVTSDHVPRP